MYIPVHFLHTTTKYRGDILFIFKCAKENFTNTEAGAYESYSIWVMDSKSEETLFYIPDVFTNPCKAHKFVELCNTHQPALIHLEDIIESFYNK